jgi:hypothetical protein
MTLSSRSVHLFDYSQRMNNNGVHRTIRASRMAEAIRSGAKADLLLHAGDICVIWRESARSLGWLFQLPLLQVRNLGDNILPLVSGNRRILRWEPTLRMDTEFGVGSVSDAGRPWATQRQ